MVKKPANPTIPQLSSMTPLGTPEELHRQNMEGAAEASSSGEGDNPDHPNNQMFEMLTASAGDDLREAIKELDDLVSTLTGAARTGHAVTENQVQWAAEITERLRSAGRKLVRMEGPPDTTIVDALKARRTDG